MQPIFHRLARLNTRLPLLTALLLAGVAVPLFSAAVAADTGDVVITDDYVITVTDEGSSVVKPSPDGITVITNDTFVATDDTGIADQSLAPRAADWDGDLLPDELELAYGLDPYAYDSDRDGLSDGDELYSVHGYYSDPLAFDTDQDGFGDRVEIVFLHTDPWLPDTDLDGVSDLYEVLAGRDPLLPDV